MRSDQAQRELAKDILRRMIRRAESEAKALKAMEKAIPWEMLLPEEEEALWAYFVRRQS